MKTLSLWCEEAFQSSLQWKEFFLEVASITHRLEQEFEKFETRSVVLDSGIINIWPVFMASILTADEVTVLPNVDPHEFAKKWKFLQKALPISRLDQRLDFTQLQPASLKTLEKFFKNIKKRNSPANLQLLSPGHFREERLIQIPWSTWEGSTDDHVKAIAERLTAADLLRPHLWLSPCTVMGVIQFFVALRTKAFFHENFEPKSMDNGYLFADSKHLEKIYQWVKEGTIKKPFPVFAEDEFLPQPYRSELLSKNFGYYRGYLRTDFAGFVSLSEEKGDEDLGRPLPAISIRVVNGEVQIRSKSRWIGEKDTWVATGDLGEMDEFGRLQLVERKGAVIEQGEWTLFPGAIEKDLKVHELVESAFLVQEGEGKAVTVVCQINREAAVQWAKGEEVLYSSLRELAKHQRLYRALEPLLDEVRSRIPPGVEVTGLKVLSLDPDDEKDFTSAVSGQPKRPKVLKNIVRT